MKIIVIGAGAIGGYVGGKLALSHHDVRMVDRAPLVEAVQASGGLRLIEANKQEELVNVLVTTDLEQAFGSGNADLVLLTVKSYHTRTALEELKPYVERVSRILSLQNGVTNEDLLAEVFPTSKVLAGTITHPVSIPRLGVVHSEKARGGVVIAPLTPQSVVSLVEDFRAAGFQTWAEENILAVKWSKLLLNLIGNATAAILDVNSFQALAEPGIAAVEVAALREALAVMKAMNISNVDLPGYPVRWLVAALRVLPDPILHLLLRVLVAQGRREKLPSLLLEMRRETGLSEIWDLNGAVANAGMEIGIPTPANATLTTTLELLVNNPAQRDRWRKQPERLVAVVKKAMRSSSNDSTPMKDA